MTTAAPCTTVPAIAGRPPSLAARLAAWACQLAALYLSPVERLRTAGGLLLVGVAVAALWALSAWTGWVLAASFLLVYGTLVALRPVRLWHQLRVLPLRPVTPVGAEAADEDWLPPRRG